MWLLMVLLAASAGAVELAAIDPATTEPRRPFTLVLEGSGFESGATVFIETARPGKFLRYQPASIEVDRLEVELPLGFGPRPPERRVYVETRDGSRTETLTLRIAKAEQDPAAAADATTGDGEQEADSGDSVSVEPATPEPGPVEGGPEISELRPAAIPAGRPVIVEVFGAGFSAESRVLVTANLHAGTSRLPEYELKDFPTYFIDAELIEVEFDRGFYPVPGAREVVVEDGSGGRSEPAIMRIVPGGKQ